MKGVGMASIPGQQLRSHILHGVAKNKYTNKIKYNIYLKNSPPHFCWWSFYCKSLPPVVETQEILAYFSVYFL